jgi:2-C-methyl-D-erythritol 2,4-cyclodiphosphate synthase
MRVGIGYDIHALKKGRRLFLGGVEIPFPKGLLGHSDGDVVLHALVDAVLGAAAQPDLGELFSDADPRHKNARSVLFVERAGEILKKTGFEIENLDVTVIAERPKLSEFKSRIRQGIAGAFGIGVRQVGFKAKTNEGFGALGKGQAIACLAVASIKKKPKGKKK